MKQHPKSTSMKTPVASNSSPFSGRSAIALLGASLITVVAAQTTSPTSVKSSLSMQVVCAPGKVPGYVSTGCVDDTAAAGGRKRSDKVRGATREPVQNMIGRGVPTVNIELTKTANSVQR